MCSKVFKNPMGMLLLEVLTECRFLLLECYSVVWQAEQLESRLISCLSKMLSSNSATLRSHDRLEINIITGIQLLTASRRILHASTFKKLVCYYLCKIQKESPKPENLNSLHIGHLLLLLRLGKHGRVRIILLSLHSNLLIMLHQRHGTKLLFRICR